MKRFVDSSTEELILWKELKLTSCIEQVPSGKIFNSPKPLIISVYFMKLLNE